jgi:hypothetical protein
VRGERPEHDLAGSFVAPECVNCDGKRQLISIAWRPLYQPQFGQTMWGSLACWHCGQVERPGVLRTHAEARRLLLFAFEVFFFGTAMGFLLALVNARLRAAFYLF